MFVAIVRSSPPIVRSPAIVTSAPSNVNAVVVPDLIIKSPDVLVNDPKVVPASFKNTSAPLASNIISPSTSKVKSPASAIVLPFIVMSSTVKVVKVPNDVILDCAAPVTVAAVPEAFPVKFPTKVLPDKAVKVFAVNLNHLLQLF